MFIVGCEVVLTSIATATWQNIQQGDLGAVPGISNLFDSMFPKTYSLTISSCSEYSCLINYYKTCGIDGISASAAAGVLVRDIRQRICALS